MLTLWESYLKEQKKLPPISSPSFKLGTCRMYFAEISAKEQIGNWSCRGGVVQCCCCCCQLGCQWKASFVCWLDRNKRKAGPRIQDEKAVQWNDACTPPSGQTCLSSSLRSSAEWSQRWQGLFLPWTWCDEWTSELPIWRDSVENLVYEVQSEIERGYKLSGKHPHTPEPDLGNNKRLPATSKELQSLASEGE